MNIEKMNKKKIIIISSPSGAGKTTICNKIINKNKKIKLSISYTSRPIRKNENQGIDYLATSRQNFPHIVFWNPRRNDQLNPIRNPSNPVNRFNFTVEIKQDLLVIFPAWLEHEVPINMAKKDRISISFNIMLRGRFSEINSKESSMM